MDFAIWHLGDNRKEPPGPSARKSCCLRFQDTLSKKACWWHKRGRPDIKHSMGKWTKRIHMLPCNDYNKIQLTIFLDFECTCDICRHIHIHTIIGFHFPSWALLCFHCFQSGFGKPFLHSTGHGNDSEWEYVSSEASILTLPICELTFPLGSWMEQVRTCRCWTSSMYVGSAELKTHKQP